MGKAYRWWSCAMAAWVQRGVDGQAPWMESMPSQWSASTVESEDVEAGSWKAWVLGTQTRL